MMFHCKPDCGCKSMFAGLETGNVSMFREDSFIGYDHLIFNPAMAKIMDSIFMNGNYNSLSREQRVFIKDYITYAGVATEDFLANGNQMAHLDLPNELLQFDTFLGNYRG